MNKFEISITDNQDKFRINIEKINDITCKMLDYVINCHCERSEAIHSSLIDWIASSQASSNDNFTIGIDIVFCDDAQIQELNTSYRGKSKPTDVLSFALFADNPDKNFIIDNRISLGEIIISTETAFKQANERKKTFEDELYFLLSHGVLHLLGFDHPDEKSLEDMFAIQQKMINFAVK